MRTLSSSDCLELWERGLRLHPLDRGLLALAAVLPETPYETLADWPLGRRNRALTEMHCVSFGRNLEGQVSCPQCGENLEFRMDAEVMLDQKANANCGTGVPTVRTTGMAVPLGTETIVVKGCSFRLPSTRDVARVARTTEPRLAAIQLLESCRTDTGERTTWLDEELEEIGESLAAADPLAEIRLTFDCAECGNRWEDSLDIVAFLWIEIENRARRLLLEVHTLAAAYGWAENEILTLSEPRRRLYLDMVRA